ncbi:MAG: AbrB/MazE/SpoVT family DNA-binding domain-containing protein [Planctomycetota bacterium]|nr:AbrB/MazE/SpoVT family DNA-binding domain-containing protein [Planctomycetota bacterium]MDA1143209.1 AbrB/MazE/SpoVT family DNA-binding domain-containing protein [Planctomycetota bacterium]
MTTTIDQAGRLVIPKAIRDQLNLLPGTQIDIEAKGGVICICPAGTKSPLIRKRGLLVHHGAEKTDLDIADFVRSQREQRGRDKGNGQSR